jgi:hypothetical protein
MAKQLPQRNTPLQQVASLPALFEGLNKTGVHNLAKQSIETVLEEGNAAQVAEAVAVMEEFIKQVRKDEQFVHFMRDELVKHNGAIRTLSGARIELCEAGITYDYSEDTNWRSIDNEIRNLIEQRKTLEEKLRRLGPGKMMVDHETGEVMVGPQKSSRSTYRITLSK